MSVQGSGGFLSLYDLKENKLVEDLDLFKGSRIHHIQTSSDDTNVLVFGGKLISLVKVIPTNSTKKYVTCPT